MYVEGSSNVIVGRKGDIYASSLYPATFIFASAKQATI